MYTLQEGLVASILRLMKPRPDNLTFRINPESKAKLKRLADAEHRTLSQMVALIVDWYLAEVESREQKGS
jgi:predicted DNA-binding protein